jgi:hypothetical protein
MKTIRIVNLILMMVFTSIIFFSCSKDDQGPTNPAANSAASFHNGAIFDKGTSESGVRQMQVVLSNQNNNFYNSSGNVLVNDTIVSVVFNSESDNMVPSGTYTFSGTPDFGPFTFGNASLYLQSTDYSSSPAISSITGGSIKVSNADSKYSITFECLLSNGKMFRKEFHGEMSYFDAYE